MSVAWWFFLQADGVKGRKYGDDRMFLGWKEKGEGLRWSLGPYAATSLRVRMRLRFLLRKC